MDHVVLRIIQVLLGLVPRRVLCGVGLRSPLTGEGPLLGGARRIRAFAAGDQTSARHPTD